MTALLSMASASAPLMLAAADPAAESGGGGLLSILVAVVSITLIVAGLVFFLGAAAGLVRFPDFYTRMHAAGKGDTLSSLLVILGFALYQLDDGDWDGAHWLVALKLLGICAFIMMTSPTSTHALMNAGYEDGCVPLLGSRGNALEENGMLPGGADEALPDSPGDTRSDTDSDS